MITMLIFKYLTPVITRNIINVIVNLYLVALDGLLGLTVGLVGVIQSNL